MTVLRTGVPVELEFMIGKCLAKDAKQRYQHADELVVDLESLREKLKTGKSTILRTGVAVQHRATEARRAAADEPSQGDHPLVKYRVIEDLDSEGDTVSRPSRLRR